MGEGRVRKASIGTHDQRQTIRRRMACVFPHFEGLRIQRESGDFEVHSYSGGPVLIVPEGANEIERLIDFFVERVDALVGVSKEKMKRFIEVVLGQMIEDSIIFLSRNGLFWRMVRAFQRNQLRYAERLKVARTASTPSRKAYRPKKQPYRRPTTHKPRSVPAVAVAMG